MSKHDVVLSLSQHKSLCATKVCIHVYDFVHPVAWEMIHGEDTARRHITYHFFETLFGLIVSKQLNFPSYVYLKKWDKVDCGKTRPHSLLFMFSKIDDSVSFTLKITLPPVSAPQNAMDVDDMDAP